MKNERNGSGAPKLSGLPLNNFTDPDIGKPLHLAGCSVP